MKIDKSAASAIQMVNNKTVKRYDTVGNIAISLGAFALGMMVEALVHSKQWNKAVKDIKVVDDAKEETTEPAENADEY